MGTFWVRPTPRAACLAAASNGAVATSAPQGEGGGLPDVPDAAPSPTDRGRPDVAMSESTSSPRRGRGHPQCGDVHVILPSARKLHTRWQAGDDGRRRHMQVTLLGTMGWMPSERRETTCTACRDGDACCCSTPAPACAACSRRSEPACWTVSRGPPVPLALPPGPHLRPGVPAGRAAGAADRHAPAGRGAHRRGPPGRGRRAAPPPVQPASISRS